MKPTTGARPPASGARSLTSIRRPPRLSAERLCMIRRILAMGVSAAALTLSLPATAQEQDRTPPPQMTFGTWGVDPAALDPAVDPGDDFFAYVNDKWLKANPIPP